MDFTYFLKGLIIGFVLPIPIGPAGILCIRRSMVFGKLHGFLTGLGAAISDMMFCIVAAFGITLISNFISLHQQEFRLAGGVVLLAAGYRILRSRPIKEASVRGVSAPALSFFSTFLVTFTNPMAVFAYAGVFAGIGIEHITNNQTSVTLIVAGVFTGSLCWFSLLTYLSCILKEKIISHGLALINRIAGSILMLFGAAAFCSGLSRF